MMDSTQQLDEEREALEALVQSEGWRRFRAHVAENWGTDEGGGRRFLQGVRDAANNLTSTATDQLRQVVVAQREIQVELGWPARRLAELTRQPDEVVGSRRGTW